MAPGIRLGKVAVLRLRESLLFISRFMMQRAGVRACRAGVWLPLKRASEVPLGTSSLGSTPQADFPIFMHTEYTLYVCTTVPYQLLLSGT